MIDRGEFLRYGFGAGALALLSCGSALADLTGSTTGSRATGAGGAWSKLREATAGPYPGDGSNGANVLDQTGVVCQDIRSSFAELSGSAVGVPLAIQPTLVSASTCTALANRAVSLFASNLSRISLATDNVFSDGTALELATVTGSTAVGLIAALTVAV